MKKSVMFIVLLLTVWAVYAFTVPPPVGPFGSSATSSTSSSGSSSTSSGFSLQPPATPFSQVSTGSSATGSGSSATGTGSTGGTGSQTSQPTCGNNVKEGSESCDGTDLGGAACPNGGTLTCTASCTVDSSTCNAAQDTSGAPATQAPASTPQSSGSGGGGGGGGSGYIRIELSAISVVKSIPVGRPVQFTRNNRPYPLTLMLRTIDNAKQSSIWVLNGKFFNVSKTKGQLLNLNPDPAFEAFLEIVSFERSGITIKASLPPTNPLAPAPVMPVTPAPTRAIIPTPEPVREEIPLMPFIPEVTPQEVQNEAPVLEGMLEESWTSKVPVKRVGIGAGVVIVLLGIAYAVHRRKSAPDTIEEYAEEGLRTGHEESEIRKRLASAGWSRKEIDAAMELAEKKK